MDQVTKTEQYIGLCRCHHQADLFVRPDYLKRPAVHGTAGDRTNEEILQEQLGKSEYAPDEIHARPAVLHKQPVSEVALVRHAVTFVAGSNNMLLPAF